MQVTSSEPKQQVRVGVPRAVAIIMDGNGRWAEERGLPRWRGHEEGAASVRAVTRECARLGVEELTLYAFSTENWRRPELEVDGLMDLLGRYLVEEREEIMSNGIVFRAIGELEALPARVREEYEATRAMSADNGGMILRLALSYGGRRELWRAAQEVARLAVEQGLEAVERLGEEDLRRFLYEPEMRDPDLVVRTAGEMRLSNFLLWQASYSELYVASEPWPEFREESLGRAFAAYGGRVRRFGAVVRAEGESGG